MPNFAEILKKQKLNILHSWMARVRSEIPAAKYQEQYGLMNSVPLVIDAVATVLEQPELGDEAMRLRHELAYIHGLARTEQEGYTAEQVAQEYLALRDEIIETLERVGSPLPPATRSLVSDLIDSASKNAEVTFARAHRKRDKKTDRYWHLDSSRYRMIVEEVEDYAIFMVDRSGHIVSWNKGTLKVKGYQPHEILGLPFRALFTEEDATIGRPEWELDYAAKHGRYIGEGWRQRHDGSRFWASVVLTALRNHDGELIGWCKITRDLTAEKRSLEELRKAEDATRAKSAFLANMSHEIRTPIGAILGYAELLQDPSLPLAERIDFAATIQRNGERLATLVDDILDLSKVEAGKLQVEKKPFSLTELLDDIYKTLSYKAHQKGLKFELECPSGTPRFVNSDPHRLRQILMNVIGNAIKFTDNGTVHVEVETDFAATKDGHDQLRFIVADSGVGISREFQKRLFEPFTQGHSMRTRVYGGTGLGLSLSRQLARALGGDLMLIESRQGQGSKFLIEINAGPRERETWIGDPSGEVKSILRVDAVGQEARQLEGLSILLAEDSLDNQKLISTFLQIAGARVDIANNGRHAVEAAMHGHHDVVLMDIQMPEMDGYEATRTLRSRNFATPIVALTAFAMKDERESSLAVGFDDYLTKPINRSALLKTISELSLKHRHKVESVALQKAEHNFENEYKKPG